MGVKGERSREQVSSYRVRIGAGNRVQDYETKTMTAREKDLRNRVNTRLYGRRIPSVKGEVYSLFQFWTQVKSMFLRI